MGTTKYPCSGLILATALASASAARGQEILPVPGPERAALIALYESTGGASWKDHTGWLGAEGSECDWYGVDCMPVLAEDGFHMSVSSLELQENNLVGKLPEELSNLSQLDFCFLWGNRITSSLPAGIRDRWLAGSLRLIGYASQFTAQVEEIVLRQRGAAYCVDSISTLRADGTASSRAERCREGGGQAEPEVYCEVRSGTTNQFAQDVDRLVYYMEASGFFSLEPKYWRNMTHGGTTEIEVTREGKHFTVVDYGAFGPQGLWAVERMIEGILAETDWDSVREERDCGFTRRDV
jgi:hypothetical protein